jgi:signal transduction histidine kinase
VATPPPPVGGSAASPGIPQGQRLRRLPLLPLAPAVVVLVAVAAAVLIALLGIHELRAQSDRAAAQRSELLASTLAARLRATQSEDRAIVVDRAARRSGAEVLLVRQDGELLVDGSLGPPARDELIELLVRTTGETTTQLGRTRFQVTPLGPPLEHLSVIAFVRAPEAPFATASLVSSVAALTAILIGAAALAAFSLARDLEGDVEFVERRIVRMAREDADPAGKPIPVRSIDQIGLLTSAFNVLVERFAAAEQAYRQDLSGALAYDRDRSAFLAALSHELRTPLNAILGFTEVLLSEVDGPLSEDARENLNVVRSSGEHLRSLIGDILDLSALESGELELNPSEVDAFAVAEDVVREARITAQAKHLSVELIGQRAPVWADARRLRQILANVVGNGIKFTTEGSVEVRVAPGDGLVELSVADTGPGISPGEQAAIFEEYRQAGESRTQRVGTGLGLAIARRLVEMQNGTIFVESALGAGSRFVIRMPSSQAGAESAE